MATELCTWRGVENDTERIAFIPRDEQVIEAAEGIPIPQTPIDRAMKIRVCKSCAVRTLSAEGPWAWRETKQADR